jgi:hypothetical protein
MGLGSGINFGEMVRGTVEETLNALLDAEADSPRRADLAEPRRSKPPAFFLGHISLCQRSSA